MKNVYFEENSSHETSQFLSNFENVVDATAIKLITF